VLENELPLLMVLEEEKGFWSLWREKRGRTR
jgi:hypothetical protein